MAHPPKTAVFCVGNKLMLDDGVGPAVFDQLQKYCLGSAVDVFDLGCLTMGQIHAVRDYDVVVTIDAVDGTGLPVGAVVQYTPQDMAVRDRSSASLHDLQLTDLFEAALLLGYQAEGICFGMQVENPSPATPTIGLAPGVEQHLADLVDAVLAQLVSLGHDIVVAESGERVQPGFHHS